MCGIVGYVGKREALPVLLEGLSKLEYRGYDSSGVAILQAGELQIERAVGKLQNLKNKLQEHPIPGQIGIGHTRWATHGGVTENNAHPHRSQSGRIATIHNGIIENYLELKDKLTKVGFSFYSETDTEVLVNLIEYEYQQLTLHFSTKPGLQQEFLGHRQLFTEAVRLALQKVEGGYAIIAMHTDAPNLLVAGRMHNPLILGLGENENLIGSDVPALLDYTQTVCDLGNGQLAEVTADQINLYNLQGESQTKQTRQIEWSATQAEKGGFAHFMIKEIYETPQVFRDVIAGKIRGDRIDGERLGLAEINWQEIDKITLLGCGSAAYACAYGKYLLERWGRITTEVVVGSEYRYHEPVISDKTLVIALSQSGETADTMASIAKAREGRPARIIGVINAMGSSMTREVDSICPLQAGPEISVASTKAFSSMALTLVLIALYVAQERETLPVEQIGKFLAEIKGLDKLAEQVLLQKDNIARYSVHYIHHPSAYYIGRDVNYPSAMEGAQKLKEVSYIHAEAYAAGELKHGPNAVIHPGFPIIALAPKGHVYKKMISNIQEMKAREAHILAIGTVGDQGLSQHADHVILLPETSEELSVLLNTIAMQLFAYYVTLYKGYSIDNPRELKKFYPEPHEIGEPPKSIDIDKPRNLAKSVTVE